MHAEATLGRSMGGNLPLGYRVQDRRVVVVSEEAAIVRECNDIYRRTRSHDAVYRYVRALPSEQVRDEQRDAKSGIVLLEAEQRQGVGLVSDVAYLQEVLTNFASAWANLTDEENVLLLNSITDHVDAVRKDRLHVHLNVVREPDSNLGFAARDQMVHPLGLEPRTR
ncbi:MAG: hypothetical protein AMXMBFR61_05500 [Fimbriimonadales bacterium]